MAKKNIAYDYILNAIVTCTLKPGQAIIEQEISETLNISRTPIREALKQLESEGLVVHFPSRGAFVMNPSVQDVEEIFQLRTMFETEALKNAIYCITEEELDDIENQMRKLDDKALAVTKKTADLIRIKEKFYESDRELHMLIMKYSGNARMLKFHKTLEVQLEQLRRISSQLPMRLASSKLEHLEIINEIRNRDLDSAAKKLTNHLSNVKESTFKACISFAATKY